MVKDRRPRLIFAVVLGCLAATNLYACPMCTELMEKGGDAFKAMLWGRGIAWSILLMFAVPMALVGGMGFAFYRSYRKTQKADR